jgi:hypothetical protein
MDVRETSRGGGWSIFSWLRVRTGSCEHDDESSGSGAKELVFI